MNLPLHLSLAEAEARHLVDGDGHPIVESRELLPAREIGVAPLAFGDTDFSHRRVFERPYEGAWCESVYRSASVRLYRLRGALVHSSSGIVMLRPVDQTTGQTGLCLLDETIQYIELAEHGIHLDRDAGSISVSSEKFSRLQNRAVHLLAPGGAYNYYHWNIDVMSRFSVLPEKYLDDVFLVPPLRCQFQWDFLNGVASRRAMRLQAVHAPETVEVDELILIPNIGDFGHFPRSEQLRVFASSGLGAPSTVAGRRLYIARRNAEHRRLLNEQEVITLLEAADYEILECETLPLAEQAQRFAEASHIVAPHGAGLTNVVYCDSRAALCELQMDLNVNWLFRRLGNLKGIRYGCVVGENDGLWEPLRPHNKAWRLPVDRLAAVLKREGFL